MVRGSENLKPVAGSMPVPESESVPEPGLEFVSMSMSMTQDLCVGHLNWTEELQE